MVINFDSPTEKVKPIKLATREDKQLIRSGIVRKELEVGRPCQNGIECDFSELTEEAQERLTAHQAKFIKQI